MESPKRGCDLFFRALRSKTLAFKKGVRSFFVIEDFPRGQGLRLGPLRSKKRGVSRLRS